MKKIILLLTGLFIVYSSYAQFAQSPKSVPPARNAVKFYNHKKGDGGKVVNYYYMDYTYADSCTDSYVWQMNTRYTASDASLTQAGESFKDWVDTLGNLFSPLTPVKVDTLYFYFSHENNSGTNDTIIFYIQDMYSIGYPWGVIFWSDTIITNHSLSPGGNWLGNNAVVTVAEFPETIIGSFGNFFVGMTYSGDTRDTLGVLASFKNVGTAIDPRATEAMYGKAYRQYSQYASYGWLPTLSGQDIYYDWNSNGNYDMGTDEAHYMQVLGISAFISAGTVGIAGQSYTNGIKLACSPNPLQHEALIQYAIEKDADVSLGIYSATGQEVMNLRQGRQSAGEHNIVFNGNQLPGGIYYYTLKAGDNQQTRKMVVVK